MYHALQQFISNLQRSTPLEYIAVVSGIWSVWLSKKESVWLYPVGLVNTLIYIFISVEGKLFGEASVNIYYTVVSIYGWWLWTRKDRQQHTLLHITGSNRRQLLQQGAFFLFFYVVLFSALTFLSKAFDLQTVPVADAGASAAAYTGMWLMAKKKVESWWWWIATNIVSIPLYAYKGYALTSVYYLVLLVLAFYGLAAWRRKAALPQPTSTFEQA